MEDGLNCSLVPRQQLLMESQLPKFVVIQLLPVAGIVYVIVDTRRVSCFDTLSKQLSITSLLANKTTGKTTPRIPLVVQPAARPKLGRPPKRLPKGHCRRGSKQGHSRRSSRRGRHNRRGSSQGHSRRGSKQGHSRSNRLSNVQGRAGAATV